MRKRYYVLLLDLVACAALAQGQVSPSPSATGSESRPMPNPPDVVMPSASSPANNPLPSEAPSSVGINAKEVISAPQAPTSLTPIKDGNVTYLSGGIGKDEADAIKKLAGKYPVEVLMVKKSKPTDEFVAASVTITDSKGTPVVTIPDAGPYLLLDLPNGKYTIQVGKEGETKRKTVNVNRKHQRVVFTLAQG